MTSNNISNKIPVVIRYSFDKETPVLFFDTKEDAVRYIREDFQRECDIDTKENGHIIGKDMETYIESDGSYAKIINKSNYPHMDDTVTELFIGHIDDAVTEWFIGTVQNPTGIAAKNKK